MAVAAAQDHAATIVGRQAELDLLAEALHDATANVVYVHAIAGMGKSALVQSFLSRADAGGIVLDCRTVEPTERGFLQASGGVEDVDELRYRLETAEAPTVVLLDHYEVFRLMDTWLRQTFVPLLPHTATLLLSGREPPVAGWFGVRGFRSVPLGPLADADACALLELRGIARAEAPRLNRIARGHPLSLVLASAGVAEHPELALEEAAMTRVVAELTRLYLEEVDEPLARAAVEAASIVRRATAPLLAAMLEIADGTEAVRRLLELPFVEAGRDGLVVHDAVREAVAGFLHGTDPARYRAFRRAAWRELRQEVREAASAELWRYTADMLYLIDNPVVREAFFPSGAQPLAVEPARPEDEAAIAAIARKHEGADAADLLERWWSSSREAFSVVRDRDGVVVGFLTVLDESTLRMPPVAGDPVVETWKQHLRDHPVPKGQIVLGLRRWLDADRGELPCASQAACWLDVKRTYMELRPALRRMYVVVREVPTYWPIVEKLGFLPVENGAVAIDGAEYASVQLDFGPGSVDGWLARVVESELGGGDEPEIDEDSRGLTIGGRQILLTPLEFGLFSHLRDREGRTVGRQELLREVWGTEFTGGSNVVDAVVRSLRRKLGGAAVVVETVRGSGYRLRSDWREHLG